MTKEKRDWRILLQRERNALRTSAQGEGLQQALNTNLLRTLDVAPALFARARGRPVAEASPISAFSVASYLPTAHEFDPNLHARAQWFYPRAGKGRRLSWFQRGPDLSRLTPSNYGILEAPEDECVPCSASPGRPWIVIVPALGVDASHFRMGYGGGYYDTFLGENREWILSVCLLPSALVKGEDFPREAHDVPVDVLVTESWVALGS
jgi:5,10-methenyltetrahydrofolate synthetase